VLPRLGTPARRLLTSFAVLAGLVGGWLWLRDSALVRVNEVTIIGAAGEQGAAIRAAVRNAASDMSTLHVRRDSMRRAVALYPIVKDVRLEPDFPHRLTVRVIERQPVAVIVTAGSKVPVAADGTLLRGTMADGVPVLPLRTPPAGDTVTDASTRTVVALLAHAPGPLRARVAKAFLGPRGLTARLKAGTALYFGNGQRLTAKWAAATAVLADASSKGATTLDLRIPERPAAGGLEQVAATSPPTT